MNLISNILFHSIRHILHNRRHTLRRNCGDIHVLRHIFCQRAALPGCQNIDRRYPLSGINAAAKCPAAVDNGKCHLLIRAGLLIAVDRFHAGKRHYFSKRLRLQASAGHIQNYMSFFGRCNCQRSAVPAITPCDCNRMVTCPAVRRIRAFFGHRRCNRLLRFCEINNFRSGRLRCFLQRARSRR